MKLHEYRQGHPERNAGVGKTPLITIQRSRTEDGKMQVIVDGREVTPSAGETTDQAATRAAAALARRRGARSVLADITDENGATWRVVVDAQGGVRTSSPRRDRTRVSQAQAVVRKLRDAWAHKMPSWPVTAVAAAALLILSVVAFTVWSLTTHGSGDPDADVAAPAGVVSGSTLPQEPPLEWRKDALWSTPPLLHEASKVAVIDGNKVGVVTADRQVAVITADGQTRWTVTLPEGEVRSPLSLTYIDTERVLAIHVGSRLVWWSVDDATASGVDLPAPETPITWRGSTPLLGIAQDQVAVVQHGQLATVAVPQGAKAVSAWADGHVVAGSSTGWWRLRPGTEPGQETPWQTPEDKPDQLNIIDGMGAYVLAVKTIGSQVHVVVHIDDGQKITRLFSDVLPGIRADEALTWRPSSSRSWGILGHAIVDMERASVTDLGTPWTTEHIIADRAMGTLGREKTIVSPDAPHGLMRPGESFPEEVLGHDALVRGRDEEGAERVWLLPPNPDVATVQPSSRPTGG